MKKGEIDAGERLDARDRERMAEEDHAGERIPGERGPVDLRAGKKATARGTRAFVTLLFAIGAAIALLMSVKAYRLTHRDPRKGDPTEDRVERQVPSLKLEPLPVVLRSPRVPPSAQEQRAAREGPAPEPTSGSRPGDPMVLLAPGVHETTAPLPGLPPVPPSTPARETVMDRRLARGFGGVGPDDGQNAGAAQAAPPPAPANAARAGRLEERLETRELAASSATLLRDRDRWLTQGAMLDCVLETRVVSTVAGMTTCHLTRDAYSASGRVVLLDRGTKLVGRYQGGMQQGEARIFVLWTRAETPGGVIVNLDSPGTGSLGEAGVGGYTDKHFWDRFGAAMLVSLVQAGTSATAARLAGPAAGARIQVEGTASASNDVVGKTLDSTVNMPPTLYANQGERIGIFVARDLDFRSVYRLEPEARDEP